MLAEWGLIEWTYAMGVSRMRPLWLLFAALPSSAAAAAVDEGLCRNGTFPVENSSFAQGTVGGSGRAHFFHDMQGCPKASAKCRLKSYLVAGDRVVTGRTRGAFVCAYSPGKGGGTAGWIEAGRIRLLPIPHDPPLAAWTGRWSDEGNPRIRFYIERSALMVEGEAAWPSFNPSTEDFPGGPNVGEIGEPVRTSANRAYARECGITFTLLHDLLVAADPEMRCGGMNVSFSGVYRRSGR